jgi:hypothetical protein
VIARPAPARDPGSPIPTEREWIPDQFEDNTGLKANAPTLFEPFASSGRNGRPQATDCRYLHSSDMIAAVQHESLTLFLNGKRTAEDLWCEIEREVNDCLTGCAKSGVGAVVITAGPLTKISLQHVAVLIGALSTAELPMAAASYIADALVMSEDFEWEDDGVAAAIFRLADESAPLTDSDLEWAKIRVSTGL